MRGKQAQHANGTGDAGGSRLQRIQRAIRVGAERDRDYNVLQNCSQGKKSEFSSGFDKFLGTIYFNHNTSQAACGMETPYRGALNLP